MNKTYGDGYVAVELLIPAEHAEFIKRFGAWARESMESGKTTPFDDYERGCIQLILVGIKLIETQPGIMNEINSQNNDTRTI